jgi:hypothetical protein
MKEYLVRQKALVILCFTGIHAIHEDNHIAQTKASSIMSKLAIFLGIILMIGAFALLFVLVIPVEGLQSNPTIIAAKNSLFCEPGERYVEDIGALISGSGTRAFGRELTIYCEDSEGQQRDVTTQAVTTIIGAFGLPFGLGLTLTLVGGIVAFAGWTRRLAGGAMSNVPVTVYSNTPGQGVKYTTTTIRMNDQEIPAEAAEVIKQVMAGFQASAESFQADGSNDTLVAKLRQLEEARDAGLISAIEYDRMRQQILDSMKE